MPFTMSHAGNFIQGEPVLLSTVVGAVLVALVQFGVPITDGQANAITAVVVAAAAFYARTKVTPSAKPAQWVKVALEPVDPPEEPQHRAED